MACRSALTIHKLSGAKEENKIAGDIIRLGNSLGLLPLLIKGNNIKADKNLLCLFYKLRSNTFFPSFMTQNTILHQWKKSKFWPLEDALAGRDSSEQWDWHLRLEDPLSKAQKNVSEAPMKRESIRQQLQQPAHKANEVSENEA